MESANVFGLDPFLVLGVATLGSGAVGWLLGPFVGERVFGLVHWRVGGWVGEVRFIFSFFFSSFFFLFFLEDWIGLGWLGLSFLKLFGWVKGGGRVVRMECHANERLRILERERFLQEDQETQGRSGGGLVGEPGAGLLWGEDWECQGVSELDEGSEGV